MEISIIVPVFNSASIIKSLVNELNSSLENIECEYIFVNDKSSDSSWKILCELAEKQKNITAINLSRNFGQDNAIMAGLNFSKGSYSVIMDDDLQHSPADIPKLINKCKEGYDVCYANYSYNRKQKKWKVYGSLMNDSYAKYIINKPDDIYLSPFKIISRLIVDNIIKYAGPYPYIDGLILRSTSSITYINVMHRERHSGKSNYSLKKSIKVFVNHITGFSIFPLRLVAFFGALIALLGFILGIYYIFQYFNGNSPEGWTTIVILILFINGSLFLALGIIGEYIGRLYIQKNKQPQYIIREITK